MSFPNEPQQPRLFDLGDEGVGTLELFPAIWSTAEALISPVLEKRWLALEQLEKSQAARFSPLVAYLLCTRLLEPNLALRGRVIRLLAGLQSLDSQNRATTEEVRQTLSQYLRQMRTRPIYAMLQVASEDGSCVDSVEKLLDLCPYAGRHLADLLAKREVPLGIRKMAVYYIGQLGYLDALPTIERLLNRLEPRLSGQQTMGFLTSAGEDEVALIADLRRAANLLRTP